MDERPEEPSVSDAPEASADPADSLTRALGSALERLREIADDLRRLLDLRLDRARIGARERLLGILLWGLVFAGGLSLIVIATLLLARGASGLLTQVTGLPWAGDLLGAVLLLLLLWGGVFAFRARMRRRGLAGLKQRYQREGARAAADDAGQRP